MSKRVKAFFFTAVLLGSLVLSSVALAVTMYVVTANGKSLNLRDQPSLDGKIITQLAFGTRVEVDDRSIVGGWGRVFYGKVKGYCMMRYLSKNRPGPQPTITPSPTPHADMFSGFLKTYYTVAVRPSSPGGYVHMRWAPSKQQPIQSDYYNGDVLLVIAENGEWCQVYDEHTHTGGFMMRAFLENIYYTMTEQ